MERTVVLSYGLRFFHAFRANSAGYFGGYRWCMPPVSEDLLSIWRLALRFHFEIIDQELVGFILVSGLVPLLSFGGSSNNPRFFSFSSVVNQGELERCDFSLPPQ
jgi:hypothetical protein